MDKSLKIQYENKYIQLRSLIALTFNLKLIKLCALLFMLEQYRKEENQKSHIVPQLIMLKKRNSLNPVDAVMSKSVCFSRLIKISIISA